MIQTENLTKKFGEVTAVDGLTMTVREGEVFGFLGPNGAGKTTTLRMLSCLIGKTAGTAVVGGHEIGKKGDAKEIRKIIGVLPESSGLYEDVSAYKNLDYYGRLYDLSESRRKERIELLLYTLGLWGKKDVAVGTFSKGMKQRLSIARAVIHDPEILFLDEPTANLDPESSKAVRDFILEQKRGKRTVFINTHQLYEVEKTCDRIGILKTRLLAIGATEELFSSFWGRKTVIELKEVQESVVKAVRDLGRDLAVDGNRLVISVANPAEENPTIIRSVVGAGGQVLFVTELHPSLEDVYLKLVGS